MRQRGEGRIALLRVIRTTTAGIVTDSAPMPESLPIPLRIGDFWEMVRYFA